MGGNRLEVYRITDFMTPLVILENPIIDNDINEDGMNKLFPDVVNEYWVGVKDLGFTFACFRIHQLSRHVWQGHAYVLPNYRKKYAFTAGLMAKDWIWENIPEIRRLVTIVPSCHLNVDIYVRKIGFELIGTLKDCYSKDKEIYDILIFSIKNIRSW